MNTSVWASGAPSLARTIRQKETPHERARSHGAVAEISRHGFEDRGSENRGSKQHCGSQRSVVPCRCHGVSTATATCRLGPKSAMSGVIGCSLATRSDVLVSHWLCRIVRAREGAHAAPRDDEMDSSCWYIGIECQAGT